MSDTVTREVPKGFLDTVNRHDLNAVRGYFVDDCVFYLPRGAKPHRTSAAGRADTGFRCGHDLAARSAG